MLLGKVSLRHAIEFCTFTVLKAFFFFCESTVDIRICDIEEQIPNLHVLYVTAEVQRVQGKLCVDSFI